MKISIGEAVAISAHVTIPGNGVWSCDLIFGEDPLLSGRARVQIGDDVLQGTIDPLRNGIWRKQTRLRVIGGAGGWGLPIAVRDFHNDAAVRPLTVAQAAAVAAGETLGAFTPGTATPVVDYVQMGGTVTAAQALEDAANGALWWVDSDGITQVGPHPNVTAKADDYDVQTYDPRSGELVASLNRALAILPGSVVTEGVDAPVTVHAAELFIAGDVAQGRYLSRAVSSRVEDSLRAIVDRLTAGRWLGLYRYRVVTMVADRVNLQVIKARALLPDLLTISMWPGVAGAHATLTPGAEVAVQFLDGERTAPALTNFAGRGAASAIPQRLELSGDGNAPNAARQGDTVRILLPPMVFSGTIGGSPATGVLAAMTGSTLGTIETGSSKVGIGS